MKKIFLICCIFLFVAWCWKSNTEQNLNENWIKKSLIKKVLTSWKKDIKLKEKLEQNRVDGF